MNYRDYITIEPNKRSGKPCVRGLRITVYEVLEYLASDMSIRISQQQEQLEEAKKIAQIHAERVNELAGELAKEIKLLKTCADELLFFAPLRAAYSYI